MYKVALTLLFSFLFTIPAKADQLAYISKGEAKKAAKVIRKMDYVFLFCGCCDNEKAEKVKVVKVEYKFTNYENYYEVILTYKKEDGSVMMEGIDLAYVWSNKIQTIGEILSYEHDPCSRLGDEK
jgi:glutamine amidotransferase-like uncharacterized protein